MGGSLATVFLVGLLRDEPTLRRARPTARARGGRKALIVARRRRLERWRPSPSGLARGRVVAARGARGRRRRRGQLRRPSRRRIIDDIAPPEQKGALAGHLLHGHPGRLGARVPRSAAPSSTRRTTGGRRSSSPVVPGLVLGAALPAHRGTSAPRSTSVERAPSRHCVNEPRSRIARAAPPAALPARRPRLVRVHVRHRRLRLLGAEVPARATGWRSAGEPSSSACVTVAGGAIGTLRRGIARGSRHARTRGRRRDRARQPDRLRHRDGARRPARRRGRAARPTSTASSPSSFPARSRSSCPAAPSTSRSCAACPRAAGERDGPEHLRDPPARRPLVARRSSAWWPTTRRWPGPCSCARPRFALAALIWWRGERDERYERPTAVDLSRCACATSALSFCASRHVPASDANFARRLGRSALRAALRPSAQAADVDGGLRRSRRAARLLRLRGGPAPRRAAARRRRARRSAARCGSSRRPGSGARRRGPADRRPPPAPSPSSACPPTAAEQAEGLPIASIEIVGNRRVGRDDVLSYLREKPGHLFKVENLTGDVHALWDSGFFDDIQVDLTTNDRGVVAPLHRPRAAEHQGGRLRGQRRDRQRQAQRGGRDQAEHDPERAGRAPQRPEDQGRLRREGLLPRRRRLSRSSRSARTRSSSSSRSSSTSR